MSGYFTYSHYTRWYVRQITFFYTALGGKICSQHLRRHQDGVRPVGRSFWAMELGVNIPLTTGYGSIPINTIFSGMNIHLPAILMWTTGV